MQNYIRSFSPQSAAATQKCLAHMERDLEALHNSRFHGNREFAIRGEKVLWAAPLGQTHLIFEILTASGVQL